MKTLTAGLFLAGVVVATACSDPIKLEGLGCPCTTGYVCCEEACIAGTECPPGQAKTDPTTGQATDSSVIQLAKLSSATPVRCATLIDDSVVWMDDTGKLAGVNVVTNFAHTVAQFPLPADPVAKCAFTNDGTNAYVTLYEAGTILELSVTESTIGAVATRFGTFEHPAQVGADGTTFFVIENDTGRVASVARPDVSTAAPQTLGQAHANAHDLVVGPDAIYWLDEFGLRKLPKNGGQTETLVDAKQLLDATGYTNEELAAVEGEPTSLLLVKDQLYWVATSRIFSVASNGGTPTAITYARDSNVSPTPGPTGAQLYMSVSSIITDGTQLLALENDSARITAVTLNGSSDDVQAEDSDLYNPNNTTLFFGNASRYVWLTDTGVFARLKL